MHHTQHDNYDTNLPYYLRDLPGRDFQYFNFTTRNKTKHKRKQPAKLPVLPELPVHPVLPILPLTPQIPRNMADNFVPLPQAVHGKASENPRDYIARFKI